MNLTAPMLQAMGLDEKRDPEAELAAKDAAAELLKTTPEALDAFERAYHAALLKEGNGESVKEASCATVADADSPLLSRIVRELLAQTVCMEYVPGTGEMTKKGFPAPDGPAVTAEEMLAPEPPFRPQCSGDFARKDIDHPSYLMLFEMLAHWKRTGDDHGYHVFHQGLDLLDLDHVLWTMLGMNLNNMSHWLPPMAKAMDAKGFFRIPGTRIARVPLPLLQMTRIGWEVLTKATLRVADLWAMEAFGLDPAGDYFIKTGTHSSKFDFRNARVTGEGEIREMGQYFLYIQSAAVQMAAPIAVVKGQIFAKACVYGVSTTNEWVVRDFVKDTEGNPTIYQGLPLHTEYRFFVDFDSDTILGMSPYWEPTLMKRRFSGEADAKSPHMRHDYVIYKAHEETLMRRYHENVGMVAEKLADVIPDVGLSGQWSVDIMQNGNDFWFIDMATASGSALAECVRPGLIRESRQTYLPPADIFTRPGIEQGENA